MTDWRHHLSPRRLWVASWLLAGAFLLGETLALGALRLEGLLGFYLGLGAGVELTLYIQGRRRPERAHPRALGAGDGEVAETIEALRALGFPAREAQGYALAAPQGAPLEERLRAALRAAAERRQP